MLYLKSIVNIRCNKESRLTFSLERQLSLLTRLQEPLHSSRHRHCHRAGDQQVWLCPDLEGSQNTSCWGICCPCHFNVQVGTDIFSYSSSHTGKYYSWSHAVDSLLFKILLNRILLIVYTQV